MAEIDEAIERQQNRVLMLEKELADAKQKLGALTQARDIMRTDQTSLSIPTSQLYPPQYHSKVKMAKDVLSQAGHDLHIDEIIKSIRERFGIEVGKPSLTATLSKYASDGKLFKKITDKKNTFGLL